jgi:hypothetical protein
MPLNIASRKNVARRLPQILLATLTGWAVGVALIIAFFALRIRPIGDDYCQGSWAAQGLLNGVAAVYLSIAGDVTQMISNILVAGIPLVYLPWPLVSFSAFLIAWFSVMGAVVLIIKIFGRVKTKALLILAPIILVSWWSFWWSRASIGTGPVRNDLRGGTTLDDATVWEIWSGVTRLTAQWLTHSMNIQAAYVVVGSLAVALFAFVSNGKAFRPVWRTTLAIIAGLAIGFSGPVLAASFAVTGMVLSIFPKQDPARLERRWHFVLFFAVTGFAAVVSNLSPGTRARSAVVAEMQDDLGVTHFELSELFPRSIELVAWVFPRFLLEWAVAWGHIGTVIVIFLLAAAAFLLVKAGLTMDWVQLRNAGAVLIFMSLVASFFNRVADGFAYPGVWHQIWATSLVFFGSCILGLALGAKLASVELADTLKVFGGISLILAVLAASWSLSVMTNQIDSRLEMWETGPAPLPKMPDIEERDRCWKALSELRDVPPR